MVLDKLFSDSRIWKRPLSHYFSRSRTESVAISSELAEQFKAAPYIWQNHPHPAHKTHPRLQTVETRIEASLRDPLTGQRLARICMNLTDNGTDDLFGDRQIVQSFELVDGDIAHAWATGAVLLMCPNNGIARYVKVIAHPASHGSIGMLRID